MRRMIPMMALIVGLAAAGCSGSARSSKYATSEDSLQLSRVVLYRNGIGYFERIGRVEGDMLRLKVRKDQVNDLLKSLTVVERRGGQAVSVSMPLDPQTWANAALATLAPGRGSLAQVLDALRGTRVVLDTDDGSVSGRIVMVEEIQQVKPPSDDEEETSRERDHRVTLLDDDEMKVVRLSTVEAVTLEDGDLAMQFHRSLDATAGEGMFQQVEIAIRLAGASEHDLVVSYVVPAPMWKPTYRVVLPENGKGKALLQGWAVVDNTSGEEWHSVRLALTSGEPIAFQYDLHTPRDVARVDLTETGVRRRATVAVGETSYGGEDEEPESAAEAPAEEQADLDDGFYDRSEGKRKADKGGAGFGTGQGRGGLARPSAPPPPPTQAPAPGRPRFGPLAEPAVDYESLRRSTLAQARATAVSGLTRFDLESPVTVPEGTSTMVAIINHSVDGEETFLFRPGGAGMGYESNPYRVVRFRNSTPFVLEPGPISIFAGGSFVGEGLSEAVGTGSSATIPFAVEAGILVSSQAEWAGEEAHVLRIQRGVLHLETFSRKKTKWTVKSPTRKDGFTVLVRHPKAGYNYSLVTPPPGVEELADGYLVPVVVPAGKSQSEASVLEQTPSRTQLSIWDGRAIPLLESMLVSTNLGAEAREKLEPMIRLRQEIGRIDTQIDGMKRQRNELDQRAEQTRGNLNALKKDPAAGALRQRLSKRLEEFTQEGDRLGRQIVELESRRLEKKIEVDDLLQNLDWHAPDQKPKAAK